ncbi:hypothetical protein HHI36_009186 [Cryptolaemus montrouzieri]|uniref:Uncharacterized protein n=1 Tax=Cryptolaemus montrouzieri TaxID=559131 RepID=A0ABD2MUM4_9CUCU
MMKINELKILMVVFIGSFLLQGYYLQTTNSTTKKPGRLQCYQCHQTFYGTCASSENLDKTLCYNTAKACYSRVFYDPFNTGYGGNITTIEDVVFVQQWNVKII